MTEQLPMPPGPVPSPSFQRQPPKKKRRKMLWLLAGIVILVIIIVAVAASSGSKVTKSNQPQSSNQPTQTTTGGSSQTTQTTTSLPDYSSSTVAADKNGVALVKVVVLSSVDATHENIKAIALKEDVPAYEFRSIYFFTDQTAANNYQAYLNDDSLDASAFVATFSKDNTGKHIVYFSGPQATLVKSEDIQ